MSKKPSKGAGLASDGEGGSPVSGKGRKLLMGAALTLVMVGGGFGYMLLGGAKAEKPAETVAAKKVTAFVDLKEMIINLSPAPSGERLQFLKLKVALEVADSRQVADIQPLIPRVEDAFQVYLRELRASDLEGSAGVYRLKEELLRRVNHAVHPARVDAVLFKDVLIQ